MLTWVDLETTGLKPSSDKILEIAVAVTDDNLCALGGGPPIVYSQVLGHTISDLVMNDVVREMHTKNGLLAEVEASRLSLDDAVSRALAFLQAQGATMKTEPMCGSTIGFDRSFLKAQMPALEAFFHYRSIDVSTVKELVRRWHPGLAQGLAAFLADRVLSKHRAESDILDSIRELQIYKDRVFRVGEKS